MHAKKGQQADNSALDCAGFLHIAFILSTLIVIHCHIRRFGIKIEPPAPLPEAPVVM
jgi:hypothetical protein